MKSMRYFGSNMFNQVVHQLALGLKTDSITGPVVRMVNTAAHAEFLCQQDLEG
jgi:hypothetical protein